MKVIMSSIEAFPQALMVATTTGWQQGTGFFFTVEGFEFAALPVTEERKMIIVHRLSGTHMFTLNLPETVITNSDLIAFIEGTPITIIGLGMAEHGVEAISEEFEQMTTNAFELLGEKPDLAEMPKPDPETPLQ